MPFYELFRQGTFEGRYAVCGAIRGWRWNIAIPDPQPGQLLKIYGVSIPRLRATAVSSNILLLYCRIPVGDGAVLTVQTQVLFRQPFDLLRNTSIQSIVPPQAFNQPCHILQHDSVVPHTDFNQARN